MMLEKYRRVTELKAQTDGLLVQLSEGEYRSLDVWANNLTHLKMAFALFTPFMDDPGFLAWLKQHDAVMVSEIAHDRQGAYGPAEFFQDGIRTALMTFSLQLNVRRARRALIITGKMPATVTRVYVEWKTTG